ncbi:glycine cleavage system protein GcvH [Allofrancisella guangzhouensis]|uniref:Glycine cleavage system H protein n=1 Tax=Allofrancisella guangzhouensis TaxID=594679 RepID=A0A0A8E5N8_9GAMM|nr:glycine cleavage system protein GcvH [Allofrancisella guangzhouensis]AJC49279.1 glycine cleavage system protein H [Allofrancisella guangzhouensis]MBK2027724.1 glycine cleavage system protein GcvH [Allofrancisella guangzhouensis]MBK2044003.1 glycine cleavage system protein GcvH [Allofrancisella guangzhouensis]MBK2046387.1 glycine cleavage system protein GcvH [Allofrancisella guangzhouensis]
MSNIPNNLKYTKTHEWIKVDGDEITVGITEHAQSLLGDLVYVELPEVSEEFSAGEDTCVVESVKAASDVYAPVDGEVIEVNEALVDNPAQVNNAPYTDGWLFKLKISDESQLADLLSAEDYAKNMED